MGERYLQDMNTASRLSICLLGLTAMALALPATKGWSTRYHVVKDFGADSSEVSLRFDSTWKSSDSLLARCMVKDSSLTTKSVERDTAVLLTDTSGKQTWSDYSCLFPWEPGGLHNWEDSKEDLGRLSVLCKMGGFDGENDIWGSGESRVINKIQLSPSPIIKSPILTIWDLGAGSWEMLRDNAFGEYWRRIEPEIGPLQKNWIVGDGIPGFVPLQIGTSWKWEVSDLVESNSSIESDTLEFEQSRLLVEVENRQPDQGYAQVWTVAVSAQDAIVDIVTKCEVSFNQISDFSKVSCEAALPVKLMNSMQVILNSHKVTGWEPKSKDGALSRFVNYQVREPVLVGRILTLGVKSSIEISELLTSNIDLDRYDSITADKANRSILSIQLMEKNGQTIRSTAIQPARRTTSPLLKAFSPEQFQRALQQMPQVRELQIVGVSGARQTVMVGQFLSWAASHRGVHWISYVGAPRALPLLVP